MPVTRQRSGLLGGGDGWVGNVADTAYRSRRSVQLADGHRKCKEDALCGTSCAVTTDPGHSAQVGNIDTGIRTIKQVAIYALSVTAVLIKFSIL